MKKWRIISKLSGVYKNHTAISKWSRTRSHVREWKCNKLRESSENGHATLWLADKTSVQDVLIGVAGPASLSATYQAMAHRLISGLWFTCWLTEVISALHPCKVVTDKHGTQSRIYMYFIGRFYVYTVMLGVGWKVNRIGSCPKGMQDSRVAKTCLSVCLSPHQGAKLCPLLCF